MTEKEENEIIIKIHKPDYKEYLFFFISGIIISVPFSVFYESFADQWCFLLSLPASRLCTVVLFTPFIEEFAKAYPLFYRHGETKQSIFKIGLTLGFGFGVTEFFFYIFLYNAPFLVRIPAIIFHASSSSIVAYGIATRKPIVFYLFAVLLHLSYNLSTFFGNIGYVGITITLLLTFSSSYYLFKKLKQNE
jgi:RsiW-degrading membrane proteinase PrsW (M82 family)